MKIWLLLFLSLALSALLGLVLPRLLNHEAKSKHLPPGSLAVPIIGNLLWLCHSLSKIEDVLCQMYMRYGPIVTLRVGSRPSIFIANQVIAHTALVAHGAIFSNCPSCHPTTLIFFTSQHVISTTAYGPYWQLLRCNIIAEILHPTRIKHFIKSFLFAMFCLLILMCFGEKLDENAVREIEDAH